ncbi:MULTISPECIES: hypothetical protein [Deinococcus]|uniref:Uncharacterized protein n=1 Tax=Deinococcus rufus TaxID=2136097 RepID=A0ABV7ZCY4_9DEIO|nr:hypothetical protein [Deinococcus sp. AB2017081]WQE93626.1 hypothetical protein U2P90_09380 [Deinococcus sp. AB2017081]
MNAARSPDAPSTPEDDRWGVPAAAGRWPTLAVLVALYAVSITPFVGSLLRGQATNVGSSVLTACASALLLGLVWRGHVWAWRFTVGLSMVAGLLVFVVGMLAATAGPAGWVVSGAGLSYLLLGTALVGTPVIRAFLDSRWSARRGRRS